MNKYKIDLWDILRILLSVSLIVVMVTCKEDNVVLSLIVCCFCILMHLYPRRKRDSEGNRVYRLVNFAIYDEFSQEERSSMSDTDVENLYRLGEYIIKNFYEGGHYE